MTRAVIFPSYSDNIIIITTAIYKNHNTPHSLLLLKEKPYAIIFHNNNIKDKRPRRRLVIEYSKKPNSYFVSTNYERVTRGFFSNLTVFGYNF